MAENPRPPKQLGAAGRALWRGVVAFAEFSPGEAANLTRACELEDLIFRCREEIAATSLTSTSATGVVRANPLVAEVGRLLGEQRRQLDAAGVPGLGDERGSTARQRAMASAAVRRHRERARAASAELKAVPGGRP